MIDNQPASSVSVVIPMFNSAATIEAQLGALANQTYDRPFEVVVADNGSTDSGLSVVAAWKDRLPYLNVVNASHRRGPATARNAGLRAAGGDFLLTCDADDIVDDKWIEAMVGAASDEAILGGPLETRDLNPGSERQWRHMPQWDVPPTTFGQTYFLTSNMAFSARSFRALGGFRSAFDQGGADVDFCLRGHEHGFELRYVPDAIVHYRFRHDARSFAAQSYRYGRSYSRLRRTHRLASRPLAATTSAMAGSAGRIARTALGAVGSGAQRVRLASQIGYYSGRLLGRLERWDPDKNTT